MNKEEIKMEIINLLKKKKDIEKEIDILLNQLVQQLCPKQKSECEPAYCIYCITETCPYIKEWRNIFYVSF